MADVHSHRGGKQTDRFAAHVGPRQCGPRDLYMVPGGELHVSVQQSGERTFVAADTILMRKPDAESLQRPPPEVGEVVCRRVAVDLGCSTAVRKHSNTVKQV